jgi:hypothetical protein
VDNIQESFGLNILEAMAAGLPVVASNWSGYRDLIVHNETGFLVDTLMSSSALQLGTTIASVAVVPHAESYFASQTWVDVAQLVSSMRALAASAELRGRMGAAGRARVTQLFDWRKAMERFGGLWREQIAEANSLASDETGHHLDLAVAFEQYPGHVCRLECMMVQASGFGKGYGFHPADPRALVLSRCQNEPVAVTELARAIGEAKTNWAVLRLLKSGRLNVVA